MGRDHPAREPIAVNIIANMLGLGMAATPAGIKCHAGDAKDISHRDEMRTADSIDVHIHDLNISSLQLIPVTLVAYRSQYGSKQPEAVLGPALAATTVIHTHGSSFLQGNGLEEQEDDPFMILWLSKILLPFVISYVIAFGLISRRPIFDDFLDGAKDGMKTVAEILPTLIGLIAAVGVVRASGLLDAVTVSVQGPRDCCIFRRNWYPLLWCVWFPARQPRASCWICFGSTGRTAASAWRHRY